MLYVLVALCGLTAGPVTPVSGAPMTMSHEPKAPLAGSAGLRYRFDPAANALTTEPDSDPSPREVSPGMLRDAEAARLPFGEAGHRRWSVHGSYGVDIKRSRNQQVIAGLGLSFFVIDTVSLDFEFNGMYVDQRGDNAWAPNFAMLLRWHALMEENWSLYLEGGAGLMYATNKVPFNGSKFNFTPQAGGGISFEINDQARLFLGARWHHISNANTQSRNPGRDSVVGYVSVSFPF